MVARTTDVLETVHKDNTCRLRVQVFEVVEIPHFIKKTRSKTKVAVKSFSGAGIFGTAADGRWYMPMYVFDYIYDCSTS